MCALMPPVDGLPGLADTGIDAFLRQYKRECTALLWAGLILGSVVFTITPLITIGAPLPAFLLPRRALDRHANKIASHRIYVLRQTVFLVKMVAGLCWGSHASVRELLALPPYPPDPGTWRSS
jgi:hypothetical protein